MSNVAQVNDDPSPCPFCRPEADKLFHAGERVLGLWDAFPVAEGHALVVPRRHVADWWSATPAERAELLQALEVAKEQIEARLAAPPAGYNIGVNVGAAAGQTVFHLHVHLIPRSAGDVPDPRGGVRHVIPARANYLSAMPPRTRPPLVRGGDDPLLRALIRDLDSASAADILVAFVLDSGVRTLEPHLEDLLLRGGRLRLLTGDYLGASEPRALRRLLDLIAPHEDLCELRVFECGAGSFHPKSYLFAQDEGGVAYVGSSNLTRIALTHGLEWNYRVSAGDDLSGYQTVQASFEELFARQETRRLDEAWIEAYARRRPTAKTTLAPSALPAAAEEELEPPPPPHQIQVEALQALSATRAEGNRAGLVVLATGLGKTWLAAFDSERGGFARVLFVAHREEILTQARRTFRRIRPEASLGLYSGQEKQPSADVVFASVQTLARREHRDRFAPDAFDYIVVDEFHHASARTYRELIAYFEPEFLLGLTATPERTDGGNLLALCDENLVYRCGLVRGIEAGLLVPFRYFGVPDTVDYEQIPWRGSSSRFDQDALERHVATQARAANALEQFQAKAGDRTIGFCCSQGHADFMAEHFQAAGVRAVAVHSGARSAPRATSLELLSAGELDIVFAVDMFNEGVDVPTIDTVLMLRPTESRVIWLQQLGRGLRKAPGKTHLAVIDYIGNHRNFLINIQALLDIRPHRGANVYGEVARALRAAQAGELDLPTGCEVTYELEAMDILESLLPPPDSQQVLRAFVEEFRERTGKRPRAVEAYHEGYNPNAAKRSHGSWLAMLRESGALSSAEEAILDEPGCSEFLFEIAHRARMTRSYKALLLEALVDRDALPGELSVGELSQSFARLARRSSRLQEDVGGHLGDPQRLARMLERNPIDAWLKARDSKGQPFFRYDEGVLTSQLPQLAPDQRETFQDLVRELAEWRLAQNLDRPSAPGSPASDGIVCKVNHSNQRPIVMPLPRKQHPELPHGWTPMEANGDRYRANLVKRAINVVRGEDEDANALPGLLRGWFGPRAGLPGTSHRVRLDWDGSVLRMSPLERGPGESYES